MTRPAVGAPLRRCTECGDYEYGGAPACDTCRALVDWIVEEEWSLFLRHWNVDAERDQDQAQEKTLAEMVAAEPDQHDWRIVDAAYDRLTCSECGERLSRGPIGCSACDLAHGFRYAAIETDRPGTQPGNEHGVRVNVSVVRRPQVTSEGELLARRLVLPLLLIGLLPTTDQAQHASTGDQGRVPGGPRPRDPASGRGLDRPGRQPISTVTVRVAPSCDVSVTGPNVMIGIAPPFPPL